MIGLTETEKRTKKFDINDDVVLGCFNIVDIFKKEFLTLYN